MAKPLLEVLRDVSLDPSERAAFTADPSNYLAEHGYEGVPAEDLSEAFGLMHDTLPAETAQALAQDPVFELPDAGDTLDDAAEVGDLAPFGEVNGDFDSALDDQAPDTGDGGADDDLDEGEGGLDDDLDLDDVDVVIGDGYRADDDLDPGDLGTDEADGDGFGTDGPDQAGPDADDGLGLGDDALGFGLGSGDVPDDATADLTDGPDDGVDVVDFDLGAFDDVAGVGLTAGTGLPGSGDPLSGDLDADFGDELSADDFGETFDGIHDVAENLPDDPDGIDIDDIGSF